MQGAGLGVRPAPASSRTAVRRRMELGGARSTSARNSGARSSPASRRAIPCKPAPGPTPAPSPESPRGGTERRTRPRRPGMPGSTRRASSRAASPRRAARMCPRATAATPAAPACPRTAGARALGGELDRRQAHLGLRHRRHQRQAPPPAPAPRATPRTGRPSSAASRTSSFSATSQGWSTSSYAPIGPPMTSTESNSAPIGQPLALVQLDRHGLNAALVHHLGEHTGCSRAMCCSSSTRTATGPPIPGSAPRSSAAPPRPGRASRPLPSPSWSPRRSAPGSRRSRRCRRRS